MGKLLGIFLLAGLAVVALKIAIILLGIVLLIFKPRETLAVMVFLGGLSLLQKYPVAGWTVIVVGGTLLFMLGGRRQDAGTPP